MMGTADELLDLMYRWMEQREHCAEQLRELARELEDLREKCNGSQCVGNSVSVVGAASLLGAGVATLCTGGLAAPFLAVLGAASTGVGVTISLVTHLTEHLSSSERTKKAQRIESESKKIAERIKRLFEQLRKECKAESFKADEDELEQRVIAKILAAIARRNGQKWTVCDSIKWSSSSGPQFSENAILLKVVLPSMAVAGLAGILVVFAFRASGKYAKPLFAEAGKQIVKKISTTALKTALKGGGMVVGGAVGLAFALPEAIDSWKEMIENNHVTEASQSLRDTADVLDKMCRTLRNQFDNMKMMMAKSQQEYEERLKKERLEKERLKKERLKKERFPRGQQEHGKPKMAGMALGFLFLFLFLFKGSIFSKTDEDMSFSSPEGSIQGKETESHMGLRNEEERQGHQTEQTGSELERWREWKGSLSTTGLKTALKGGGMVVEGAVGLAFTLQEAIDSCKKMIENNHVTEASQSLRGTTDDLDKMCRTLRNQFDDMKQGMAQRQREYEERLEKERLEEEMLERERLEKERLENERLENERLEKEWFPRRPQEHRIFSGLIDWMMMLGLSGLIYWMTHGFSGLNDWMMRGFSGLIDWMMMLGFSGLIDWMMPGFSGLIDCMMMPGFSGLIDWMMMPGFSGLIDWMMRGFSGLIDWMMMPGFSGLIDWMMRGFSGLIYWMMMRGFSGLIDWMMPGFSGLIHWMMMPGFSGLIDWMMMFGFSGLIYWIMRGFSGLIYWMMMRGFSGSIDWMKRGFSGSIDWMKRGFSGSIDWMKRGFSGSIDLMKRGFSGLIDWMKRGFSGSIDWIKRDFSRLIYWMMRLGFNILINWMKRGFSGLIYWMMMRGFSGLIYLMMMCGFSGLIDWMMPGFSGLMYWMMMLGFSGLMYWMMMLGFSGLIYRMMRGFSGMALGFSWALGFLFLFLFLFKGSIFCKTDKDMSLSSPEGSIQGKETDSHMGLRHEEERQGHQTEWTGSELERWSERTGSESIQRETPFVRAALLNVLSMNNKTSNISELIKANQLDVLFTTETFLKLNMADDVVRKASPQNFSFFRHVSERIGYRGVAIQFSPVLHGRQIQFDNMETFECVVTVLQHDEWEEPVLSINLYRPPPKTLTSIRKFLKEFQELLNEVSINYSNIILTGDFNIWVDCDKKTYVKEFDWFLRDNGFVWHPREPTFRCSSHFLDLVLAINVEVSDVKIRDHQISDHNTMYFNWRPVPKDKKTKTRRGWETI